MTKLYAVNCAPLKDNALLEAALPRLGNARAAKVCRLQHPQKRAQCATAGLLLTHLFGTNGQPPILAHGSRGKPYLADNRTFFNLSHSGDWVFCAVSDTEVGIDAQAVHAYNDKIAKRSFTAEEYAWVMGDDTRFTQVWTRKEAHLKFTGFGLVLPMSSFCAPLNPDGWDEANHCCWKEYTHGTMCITVCCGEDTDFSPLSVLPLEELT